MARRLKTPHPRTPSGHRPIRIDPDGTLRDAHGHVVGSVGKPGTSRRVAKTAVELTRVMDEDRWLELAQRYGWDDPKWADYAAQINRGEQLDFDSDEVDLFWQAVGYWAEGGPELRTIRQQMDTALRNPHAPVDTPGALLMRVLAAAPVVETPLYRGMANIEERHVPRVGDVIALGPTSFSESERVADTFASRVLSVDEEPPPRLAMVLELAPGSRSLNIGDIESQWGEREFITMGRFRVTGVRTEPGTVVDISTGERYGVVRYVVQVEPVE